MTRFTPVGSLPLLGLLVLLAGAGCQRTASVTPGTPDVSAKVASPIRFTEVAEQVGIRFQHVNGVSPLKRMPETVGSGCAWFDYDNDGDPDLLIVNGRTWPDDKKAGSGAQATTHLYRNDGGRFTDVSHEIGLDLNTYGMGVAVGDYDGDGWEDVFITSVGPNHLFRNEGGKRFVDVTQTAGVVGVPMAGQKLKDKWSSGASWFDYDNDGKLDLWVCQYVLWSPENDPFCGSNGKRGYCPPNNFEGAHCTLYHNEGNGVFKDVSHSMGLFDCAVGKSFSVGLCDFNHDGWMDLVVTNDTWANFLFMNEQGKRFSEQGVASGIAYGESGRAKAGMGVDIADTRNNGSWSVGIGNFTNEGISLFEPDGDLLFTDQGYKRNVAVPSLKNVTFALFFFDYDNDGWQDLFATNGHVDDIVSTYQSEVTFRQKPLLLHSEGGTRFTDVTSAVGLDRKLVGRGAAYADFDGDGDLDVALVDNGGKFLLFRNDGGNQNHWIRFRLEGTTGNRDAIGATVKLTVADKQQSQRVKSGGSFLSESDRRLTFGLGQQSAPVTVEIRWPDGKTETASELRPDTVYVVRQGSPPVADPRPNAALPQAAKQSKMLASF